MIDFPTNRDVCGDPIKTALIFRAVFTHFVCLELVFVFIGL